MKGALGLRSTARDDHIDHQVFISYAQPDKRVAFKICAALEESGLGCWIAPRDVVEGDIYFASIEKAIQKAKLFILVYSSSMGESNFVPRELERAVSLGLRIIPFRIEDAPPPEGFSLLLGSHHWFDATSPPLDGHIQRLTSTIRGLLGGTGSAVDARRPSPEPPPGRKGRRLQGRQILLGSLGLAVLGVGIALALLLGSQHQRRSGSERKKTDTFEVSLSIRSLPTAAVVLVNGDSVGTTPIPTFASRPGTFPVRIVRPGYEPLDTSMVVTEAGPKDFVFHLRELPAPPTHPAASAAAGTVSITSQPSQATVWIDGRRRGTTPFRADEVDARTYAVEISKDGYQRFSKQMEVRPGRTSTIEAVLQPLATSLSVTSNPDGATVILDGEKRGTTPCVIENLHTGRYDLVIEKDGYRSHSESATVEPGTGNTAPADLSRLTSTLRVQVVPAGLIYIDKERKTQETNAPYTTQLVPGTYELTAVSLTWGRWMKTVVLDGREDREVIFDFSKEYRITVTSDPANARILVNDTFTGKYTPSIVTLRPGQRSIEVQKEGYEMEGKPVEITLEGNVTEPIHFVLTQTPGK